jgi:hypothetical protein
MRARRLQARAQAVALGRERVHLLREQLGWRADSVVPRQEPVDPVREVAQLGHRVVPGLPQWMGRASGGALRRRGAASPPAADGAHLQHGRRAWHT